MGVDFSDPIFLAPPEKKIKGRRGKRCGQGAGVPVPDRSARLYVYIDPSRVHMLRFFLEARDNLGLLTVVDRWRAALLLRFSPQQEQELRDFLEELRESLPLEICWKR